MSFFLTQIKSLATYLFCLLIFVYFIGQSFILFGRFLAFPALILGYQVQYTLELISELIHSGNDLVLLNFTWVIYLVNFFFFFVFLRLVKNKINIKDFSFILLMLKDLKTSASTSITITL